MSITIANGFASLNITQNSGTYTFNQTNTSILVSDITTLLNNGVNVIVDGSQIPNCNIILNNSIITTGTGNLTLTGTTITFNTDINIIWSLTLNGNVIVSWPNININASGIIGSATYNYLTDEQTYIVPDGITQLQIDLVGGCGGKGGYDNYNNNGIGVSGGNIGGPSGFYSLVLNVQPGYTFKIAPGKAGENGGNQKTNTGRGIGGTNAFGIASGGTGGNAGNGGSSGGGGGGGAASVIKVYNALNNLLGTFYGAGAGGGGGDNNTVDATNPGIGGTTPGLDVQQYISNSPNGMNGTTPGNSVGNNGSGPGGYDGGGCGAGGGGFLGGQSFPSYCSYYNPGSGNVLTLKNVIFANDQIYSLNGSGEYVGQGGNRGSNGYVLTTNAPNNLVDSIISDTAKQNASNTNINSYIASNGYIKVSQIIPTSILVNGNVNASSSGLNISFTTPGIIDFKQQIGQNLAPNNLVITSSLTKLNGSVNTNGSQIYNGNILLINDNTQFTSNGSLMSVSNDINVNTNGYNFIINGILNTSYCDINLNNIGNNSIVGSVQINGGNINFNNISANNINIQSLGSTNNINANGSLIQNGLFGGIIVEAIGNVKLLNVTNNAPNGIKITGGKNINAGTTTGGYIIGLGNITNTNGIIMLSTSSPTFGNLVAGQVGSIEYAIGITTNNASTNNNITYNTNGGTYNTPLQFNLQGNYGHINYRANFSITVSYTMTQNYIQTYWIQYNSQVANTWLSSNNTIVIQGSATFGVQLPSINYVKNNLRFANNIGNNSNNAQNTIINTNHIVLLITGIAFILSNNNNYKYIINKAPLTIKPNNKLISFGSKDPVFTFFVVGVLNGDTVSSALDGTLTTTNPSRTIGRYLINSGLSSINYEISYDIAYLTIISPIGDNVKIMPHFNNLKVKKPEQLYITNYDNINLTGSNLIQYSSSDNNIAIIDINGVIYPLKEGKFKAILSIQNKEIVRSDYITVTK